MVQKIPSVSVGASQKQTFVTNVKAGQAITFAASGRWRDGQIPSGPEGYRHFIRDMLVRFPPIRSARWLSLIGVFKDADGQMESFPIGRGVTSTFQSAGQVFAHANDRPEGFANNSGSVSLSFVDGGLIAIPKDDNPATLKGLLGTWNRFRQASGRTAGIAFIAGLLLAAGFLLDVLPQGRNLVRTIADQAPAVPMTERPDDNIFSQRILFFATLTFMAIQAGTGRATTASPRLETPIMARSTSPTKRCSIGSIKAP